MTSNHLPENQDMVTMGSEGSFSEIRYKGVGLARENTNINSKILALVNSEDVAGEFTWEVFSKTLLYASYLVGQISDDIVSIDNALKWGFGWDVGPFEVWDALGFKYTIDRMKEEGKKVPDWVEKMNGNGEDCFYKYISGVKKYYKLDRSGKSMVRQGVNVGVGSGVGSSGPPKSKEMIKFLNYATKNKDTIKDKTITEIIQASGANVGKSNARKRLKENKIKIGTADQSTVLKEVKLKTEKPIFNGINNFAKNWINKNQKKYGVTEYDKFISDFANAWQKELNKPLYKNYGGDRILSNPDGTPKTNTLFGKQETGFTINGLKPPNERTSGLFYKRVFYKNKLLISQ